MDEDLKREYGVFHVSAEGKSPLVLTNEWLLLVYNWEDIPGQLHHSICDFKTCSSTSL